MTITIKYGEAWGEAWDEYEAIRDKARAECDAKVSEALAECVVAQDKARAECDATCVEALDEYNDACHKAEAGYNVILEKAWKIKEEKIKEEK